MTAALVGLGIHLLIWPSAIAFSKFQFMLDVISVPTLTAFYLTIGWLRALALYLNGGWPIWGARVRAVTAIGAAVVWLQMDVSLLLTQTALGAPPSPSISLFSALVFAELYSTYRAARDAGFR